jgi:hypothetical protein
VSSEYTSSECTSIEVKQVEESSQRREKLKTLKIFKAGREVDL